MILLLGWHIAFVAYCQVGTDAEGMFFFQVGCLKFAIKSDSSASLVCCDSAAIDSLEIPSIVNVDGKNHVVSEIAFWALSHCESLSRLTIPSTVTSIDASAFIHCKELKHIRIDSLNPNYYVDDCYLICKKQKTLVRAFLNNDSLYSLPDEIRAIESHAFDSNHNVKTVIMGNSVKWIGRECFRDCINLRNVILSDSIGVISKGCFKNCIRLDSVRMPNSLYAIQAYAFDQCKNLKEIRLPNKLKHIQNDSFNECLALKYIYNSSNLKLIKGSDEYGGVAKHALSVIEVKETIN